MSSASFLESALSGFAASLRPLRDAIATPEAFAAFINDFGWTLSPADLAHVTGALGELSSLPDDTSKQSVEELTGELLAATAAIRQVAASSAPAAFASTFPRELLDDVAYSAIAQGSPGLFGILHLVGVLAERAVPADPAVGRGEHTHREVHWDRLASLADRPAETFRDSYGWGGDFDGDALLRSVGILVRAFGGNAGMPGADRHLVVEYYARAAPQAAGARNLILAAPSLDGSAPSAAPAATLKLAFLGLPIPPSPTAAAPADGLALMPVITGQAADTVALSDRVSLELTGDFLTRPVRAELHPGSAVVRATPGDAHLDAGARLDARAPAATPWLAFGDASSSRLEVSAVHAGLGMSGEVDGDLDFQVEVGLDAASLVIDLGEGDSFVQSVLPSQPARSPLSFTVKWSSRTGFALGGQPKLALTLPVHQSLGGAATIESVALALGPVDGNGIALDTTVTLTVSIGPIAATIADVGVRSLLAPVEDAAPPGNLGNVDLQFGFKPPNGLGLTIDAGPVSGGGFLFYDPAQEQYAGALQLEFSGIALKAVGILTTRLPGGAAGFSLLVIVSAEFSPVQLGLGFTLEGVGGLLGINRVTAVEPLRAGLRSGTLGTILFPADPVGHAQQLVAAISTVFPPAPGRHVFGPTARIGWGTPTLVTIDIALVLELPAPVRLIILGRLRALLPDEQAAVVRLEMDVLGVIDFDRREAAADAVLVDSRLAGFPLTGAMAMRMSWGASPGFLLAVGGFHPRFLPPPGFPALERVSVALTSGDNPRLRLEGYLAVTSNTLQFGARLDLSVRAGRFGVAGFLSFDALLEQQPLSFVVEIAGALAVTAGGHALLSVTLQMTLSGPQPWHARGRASFSILFFDVSVSFDVTIGDAGPPALPQTIEVAPLLLAALADARAWSAQLPTGGEALVTLRALAPNAQILAHPHGTLQVRQRLVPLERTLERFGGDTPAGARLFRIGGATLAGRPAQTDPLDDLFAPAQFTSLTDDEKLSQPSFSPMRSGARIGEADVAAGTPLTVQLDYEQTTVHARAA